MEKGLFNSIFLLIMLALMAPTISLLNVNQNIIDTSKQINNITLTIDSVIADGLSDAIKANDCGIPLDATTINTTINNYITNLENERKKYSSIECTYELNGTISGNDYIGDIDIKCNSQNSTTKINIKKKLYFNKHITAIPSGSLCYVKIEDNLDPGYIQVDLNQ
ncbi:MAG TPA: hypothetical protein P5513_05865 [Candidatus Diapherotrites archaeon]|nr:hypothetical protein [Candidatus Diapherotrites archaeon]